MHDYLSEHEKKVFIFRIRNSYLEKKKQQKINTGHFTYATYRIAEIISIIVARDSIKRDCDYYPIINACNREIDAVI